MMGKTLYSTCIGLALALPVLSQSVPGDIETPRVPARSAWLACTSIPEGLESSVMVMSGKDIVRMELPRFMTSDPVKIPKDGIIRILREVPSLENPAKIKYHVLAEAKISANISQALIILFPMPKPQGEMLFKAMVKDLAEFKGGDRMFINLSNTHIRVKFGKTLIHVPPSKVNTFEAPRLSKPTNTPIEYTFYHPVHKQWRILSASTVVLRPTRREINIFNDGSRIGAIDKHKILFPLPVNSP